MPDELRTTHFSKDLCDHQSPLTPSPSLNSAVEDLWNTVAAISLAYINLEVAFSLAESALGQCFDPAESQPYSDLSHRIINL